MRGGSRITITPAILSPAPGTYTPTPTPPSVRPPPKEFPPLLPRNNLHMHKVTIPPHSQSPPKLPELLEEILEMLLDLARVDAWGDHVGEEEGWGDGGTVVDARAAQKL
ncbi:hypothetical protein F2Q69_00028146 [Brassica cretica]|uniref:Uncharacterized protein n=1 Tax=Brassica cretica TaxID=69181 RepID=A0A8S9S802_BRACR|nr:hypothetical protein F2Q69_00028146 [Brassica cretica]